ncbi:MAG: DNA mismatch repair protein MutT, partial [Pseudomonadota bacterium]
EVVLAELAQIDPLIAPASVPFFKNDDEESLFLRLRGKPMDLSA